MWSLSDESLLAGLASGDPESAAALLRRFQARVFGLALTIVGDRESAREVAQETLIRAWRYAAAPRPPLRRSTDCRPSSRHHPTQAGLDGLDDHGRGNTILMVDRDRPPHDLDDLVREERHQGGILDPERPASADPHVHEPGSLELLGEDTLRQGSRHSPGPGALIVSYLRRQLAVDREIGHADPASRPEQPKHLRERSTLPSRQVQDPIGDHHIDRLVRKGDVFHLSADELGSTW